MPRTRVLILGCGFTGTRLARRLVAEGHDVIAASRHPDTIGVGGVTRITCDLARPETLEQLNQFVSGDTLVLHSIPPGGDPGETAVWMKWIQQAHRTVYLSATGVYGSQSIVDERTLPTPETARTKARVAAEEAILGSRGGLVLRPAAIYGPGRGVHIAVREGTFRLAGDGSNFVSRIHVDDLTAHCQAALFSDLGGAWPVADEEPCTSREIAEFCTALYGGTPLRAAGPAELGETRRADRRVDGSAVRRLLNIQLRYPSYRAGIPACIAEEALTPFPSNSIVRAR